MEKVDPEILAIFFDDADGCLQTLNEGLLQLEQDLENGTHDQERVNALFRAFHSLKGASGMLGFSRINALTHRGETLLDGVRARHVSLDSQVLQALFRAQDGLSQLMIELKTGEERFELEPIFTALDEVLKAASGQKVETKSGANNVKLDLSKYLPAFLDDAQSALSSLEESLLVVDQSIDSLNGGEIPEHLINDIFRNAHQIKGLSGSMGFTQLNLLTHEMESLLDRLRSHQLQATRDLVTVLLRSTDGVKEILSRIAQGLDPEIDVMTLLTSLAAYCVNSAGGAPASVEDKALALAEAELESLKRAWESGQSIHYVKVDIDPNEPMPGMKAFIAARNLARLGEMLAASPKIASLAERETLGRCEFVLAGEKVGEEQIREAVLTDGVKRCDVQALIRDGVMPWDAIARSAEGAGGAQTGVVNTMRVDVDRLDRLLNMSGELVINKARFLQIEAKLKESLDHRACPSKILKAVQQVHIDLTEAIHQMDLASSGIQKAVMDIRMVPVGPLFGRFKRVIRDIGKELDKDIRLVIKGEDTELDKKVADELSDPLTHLVRNAADHGIENMENRQKAGKSEQGQITLNAFHRGNRVHISIADDGKGLDPIFLRRKALEKGLYSQEALDKMSNREAIQLIFHPGFSTAQKVTSISGRGVGMDIVKKRLEELNGSIEIESEVGKGATFLISLPLTLAIQKSLLCVIADTVFAVPLESVVEIIHVDGGDVKTVRGERVVRVRDKVIPVKRLGEFFRNSSFLAIPPPPEESSRTFVILGNGANILALEVDRLVGEEDIVVKSLSKNMGDIFGVAGASILGSGRIALILDVAGLLEHRGSPESSFSESEASHVA